MATTLQNRAGGSWHHVAWRRLFGNRILDHGASPVSTPVTYFNNKAGLAGAGCVYGIQLLSRLARQIVTSAECRAKARQKLALAKRHPRQRRRFMNAADCWTLLAARLAECEALARNGQAVKIRIVEK